MNGTGDPGAGQRCIDRTAKAAFLAALRRGARREDAAEGAGFSLTGFYGARARDPVFRTDWAEALADTPARERRTRAYETRGEIRIAAVNRRIWQRRRRRHVRFTADRQAVFLARFAMDCDTTAAAAAAGVCEATVHRHVRIDPVFAEAYAEALQQGYAFLEAEAVRLRLEAQKRLRAAIEVACPERSRGGDVAARPEQSRSACPHCGRTDDPEADFDRVMKLLARHDRKPRRPERGFKPGGLRQAWTFDRAIALLGKKLKAMGVELKPLPPKALEDAERWERVFREWEGEERDEGAG